MKKFCSLPLLLLLLGVYTQNVFPDEEEYSDLAEPVSRSAGQAVLHGLIGGAESLLLNGIIMLNNYIYNDYTGLAPWALPTADSIRKSLSQPWEWENTDGFIVNQFSHPLQGSFYYTAGRANGFGFYESAFFSLFGSFTWETFFEANHASINDFITTITGSLSMGEILYRVYLEACAAGVPAPIAFLLNPMAGFHRFITGWEPPDYGRNFYHFQAYLGAGYVQTGYSISAGNEEMFSFRGPAVNLGAAVIYGDPFDQAGWTAFEHFEAAASFGLNMVNYMKIRFISDGYLFSFSPLYTDTDMMSTGLSLQFDFVALGKFDGNDSTINQYSNALDWTIKYQHLFSENAAFQIKFHAGFTFMGVSDYYSPESPRDIEIPKHELKNYGPGLNSKLFVNLAHKKCGRLELGLLWYMMWLYPKTSVLSQAEVYWLFADLTYSYNFTKNLSLGITDSFSLERGVFSGFPDTRKNNNEITLFIAWNL
jgi:hypothetical protein